MLSTCLKRMICKRCQRSLRSSEGLKCGTCDSKYHLRCVSEACPERGREGGDRGDRGYQWQCALCQTYAKSDNVEPGTDLTLLQAIHAISEKFELVNKIQLPKLNTDLMQIKSTADRIAKQNNDILRKINEIEEREKKNEENNDKSHQSTTYRKRNVSFSQRSNNAAQTVHELPTSFTEKSARCRARRRSYLWHRIFNLLNRKVNRRTPRKTNI